MSKGSRSRRARTGGSNGFSIGGGNGAFVGRRTNVSSKGECARKAFLKAEAARERCTRRCRKEGRIAIRWRQEESLVIYDERQADDTASLDSSLPGDRPATRSSRTKVSASRKKPRRHHLSCIELTFMLLSASLPSQPLGDPDEMERQLKSQLQAMSLYASQTSGDGNCLFR